MDKDQLIKRLMATFLTELEEHVGVLNNELMTLEKEPSGPGQNQRLQALFRTAHSLKGAARAVSVEPIEESCHRLEEILEAVRAGQVPLNRDLFTLLFEMADALEEAGKRLQQGADLADSSLEALRPRLEAAAFVGEPSVPSPSPSPSPSPTPRNSTRGQASSSSAAVPSSPRVSATSSPEKAETPKPRPPAETGPSRPEPAPATSSRQQGAAAPPPPPPEVAADSGARWASVRIPAEKLDALLSYCGELLVTRRRIESRAGDVATLRELVGHWMTERRGTVDKESEAGDLLAKVEKELDRLAAAMIGDGRQLGLAAEMVDEQVRRVRMLPFAEACQGLERAVRDLARSTGKEVELVIEGGDVELDRSILEGLRDPLLHLVRNAVDHGLELPEKRAEAGKPPVGRVVVAAELKGDRVEVVVSDDGRGLDLEGLRGQLRRRGLHEPEDEHELVQAVFLPGVSTTTIITNVSGRGVGLDVVKSRVEALHGSIGLSSTPGHGTRFALALPLTLTTLRAVLVEAAGQIFALATTHVRRLVRLDPDDLRSIQGREVMVAGGAPVPIASLAEILGLPAREAAPARGKVPALVVSAGEAVVAFAVDALMAEQEVVVKGLGARIQRVRHVSGATILPTGRVALVLNAAHLVRSATGRAGGSALATWRARSAPPPRRRLLVADDSVTTRTLERSILEAAGYDVTTAVDGEDAWRLLQDAGADLLISDVDMPRMDGFDLTRTIRDSARFRDLPVILFTSHGSEQDRARGIEVGADAYIVKGDFDQHDLVETISQLL